MVYSFRTNSETDRDIEEVLSHLSGKERSAFIKEAIRFYVRYSEIIGRIDSNVLEVLNMLKSSSFPNSFSFDNFTSITDNSVPVEKKPDDEAEKILQDSIMSLMDF